MLDRTRLLVQVGLYLIGGVLYGVVRTIAADGSPSLAGAVAAVDMQFLVPTAAAVLGAILRPPPQPPPGRPWPAALACAAAFAALLALAWLVTGGSGAVPLTDALGASVFGALRAAVAGAIGTLIGAQVRPSAAASPPAVDEPRS